MTEAAAADAPTTTDMRHLVLFDIDGTLLSTNGAAGRAFAAALTEIFGTSGPLGEVSFAGKTDPQIAHELMAAAGLPRRRVEEQLPALWSRYLDRLEEELREAAVRVFPGVEEILEIAASHDGAVPGLLTGNIEAGARRKLDAAGIGFARFRVGAFGSDNADRNALAPVAVARAEAATGVRIEGKALVIVGDTPADIACGEVLGARTVAVATGVYSGEQLAACRPDFLFDSLEDFEAVWEAIVS